MRRARETSTLYTTRPETALQKKAGRHRIRTGDPFITSEVLWPAELRRPDRASIGPLLGRFRRARSRFLHYGGKCSNSRRKPWHGSPTGRRIRPLTVLLGIALIALLAGTVGPAMGGPTVDRAAAGALAKAKRALAIAKQADIRSKLALKKAGTPGPRGPEGPPGARAARASTAPTARGGRREPPARWARWVRGPGGSHGSGRGRRDAVHRCHRRDRGRRGDGSCGSDCVTKRVIRCRGGHLLGCHGHRLSSNPLAVPFAGRLMATATVQLRNPSRRPARGPLQAADRRHPGSAGRRPTSASRTRQTCPPGRLRRDGHDWRRQQA